MKTLDYRHSERNDTRCLAIRFIVSQVPETFKHLTGNWILSSKLGNNRVEKNFKHSRYVDKNINLSVQNEMLKQLIESFFTGIHDESVLIWVFNYFYFIFAIKKLSSFYSKIFSIKIVTLGIL